MILLKLLRFWLPVVFYAGLIFWASSLPGGDTPALFPHMDKGIHVVEYGIFGWLIARALTHASACERFITIYILVIILVILYGMSDEYHQSFVSGRSSDILDIGADSLGGAIGGWFYKRFNKYKDKSWLR